MKQFSKQDVEMLLETLRTDPRYRASPWNSPQPLVPGAGEAAPFSGVERRLVRRAEVLWEYLCGEESVPHASEASALLAAPFVDNALLIVYPRLDATIPAGVRIPAIIAHVGEKTIGLGPIATGEIHPDASPDAPLACRFAATGARAVVNGAPERLDSEDLPTHDTPGAAPILMRSLALPIHNNSNSSAAIIIISWRKLLSIDETVALHREMAAANAWLHRKRS